MLNPTIVVFLSCNDEMIKEKDIKILNVEEGNQGQDVVEFKCPECGKIHTSNRYRQSY